MEEKKKFSKLKAIVLLVLIVLSAVLIGFVIISPYVAAVKHYESEAKKKIKDGGELVAKQALSGAVYDKDDNEIIVFKSDMDKYYIYNEQMSDVVKNAFVMIVDQGFYKKEGAGMKDLLSIARDDRNAKRVVPGISSITRLIAREMFLSYDLEKDNIVMEVFVANELEKAYSKGELYEFYVNNLYFNNGFFGVEAAARGYFGKELKNLSISEVAFLAAIAEDPQLDPYVDKESLMVKRNVIITRLLEDGIIDKADYFSAIGQVITLGGVEAKQYNYVESYVLDCTVKAIMENEGFVYRSTFETEEEKEQYDDVYKKLYAKAVQDIYKNGYKIHTSFDMKLQEKLQETVDKALAVDDSLEGAAVCIDNASGKVVALVGGRSVNTSEYVYNRAFEAYTPAGLLIAPLNVYTPFISWHHNLDYIMYREEALDGTYINKVTLRDAILAYDSETNNKIYSEIKPGYALSLLDRAGFKKALNAPLVSSAWGSVSVSPLELATGYETLASDGEYRPSTCIEEILDSRGTEVYKSPSKKDNVFAANDSRLMTELLQYNISDGFLKGYQFDNAITAAMAGKVGNGYESFFAGYSTYYTMASYAGYKGADTQNKDNLKDTTVVAGDMWKSYMSDIHEGTELKEFPKSGPYSHEVEVEQEVLQPTTERPSLGGEGGHPDDGDDKLGYYSY